MTSVGSYTTYVGGAVTDSAEPYAGGTDLIPMMRSGLHVPASLVDLKSPAGPTADIVATGSGWRIGAGATLADVEDHPDLPPVLRRAAGSAATRQIRNRATIGGNLLQRPRCSYFRDPAIGCFMSGGEGCPARDGLHEHLGFDTGGTCIATQPSDPAGALVALEALVTYEVDGDASTVAVADLLAAPTDAERRLHRLPAGAIVRHLDVPAAEGPSTYRKAMDRAAWQFALVGVAVVRHGDGARVVANGIAPTPQPLPAVGEALGGDWSESSVDAAADAAVDGLRPLDRNRYKVALLRGTVRRALDDVR